MVKRKSRSQAMGRSAWSKPLVRAQGGYLMVSLMIVLFVTGALLTLYAERQSERSRLERGEQIGYALSLLGAGLDVYLDNNYVKLAADRPIVPGIANALQPSADELIRQAHIRGAATVPPIIAGASYKFLVSYPPGCTADKKLSEIRCRPVGLAYIDKPLVRGTNADYVALARAARVMKGRGGYSRPDSASRFTFPDGGAAPVPVPISNPTNVAGILAWRADTLPEDEERLKTNGGNRMNNTLRLDGHDVPHDLVGAQDISASGTLSARNLVISGGESIAGNSDIKGNSVVRGNETINDWLDVKNRGIWTTDLQVHKDAVIDRRLTVGGNLSVGETTHTDTLHFTSSHNPGQSCEQRFSVGISSTGELVLCRNFKWELHGRGMNDVYYWTFEPPYGFLKEFSNYTYVLGNFVYCRDVTRSSTLWFDQDKSTWKSSAPGNSGWHKVLCYKRL